MEGIWRLGLGPGLQMGQGLGTGGLRRGLGQGGDWERPKKSLILRKSNSIILSNCTTLLYLHQVTLNHAKSHKTFLSHGLLAEIFKAVLVVIVEWSGHPIQVFAKLCQVHNRTFKDTRIQRGLICGKLNQITLNYNNLHCFSRHVGSLTLFCSPGDCRPTLSRKFALRCPSPQQ